MTKPPRTQQQINNRDRLTTWGLVIGLLIVWEILAKVKLISPIIFPAPTLIFSSFLKSLLIGKYNKNVMVTFSRVFSGFLIGGGAGMILGLLMGWSRRMRRVLDPIIAALHPIPKFALLPMVLIIFGLGESSRIVMVSIGAFFPMLINTMAGVMQVNPTYYDVVENYGASRFDSFWKVALPGSLPLIITGARLSLRSSLTLTIGVEMVFGNNGLGSELWLAWETMRMTDMYSTLLIVSVIGLGSNMLLEQLKKKLIPWHQEIRPEDD
jgi:ABC-type nitrate/sulfonate/bicarbonate transport system permease component